MNTYNKNTLFPSSTLLNTDRTSIAVQLEDMYGFAIQLAYTATSNGQFKLQSSCDPVPKQNLITGPNGVVTYVGQNWTDITGSTAVTSASTGNIMWNYTGSQYDMVRVQYQDNSSGSSSAIITSSIFNGKGV